MTSFPLRRTVMTYAYTLIRRLQGEPRTGPYEFEIPPCRKKSENVWSTRPRECEFSLLSKGPKVELEGEYRTVQPSDVLYLPRRLSTTQAQCSGPVRASNPAPIRVLKKSITLQSLTKDRFRWLTCQIDHICALSNDRSRRKALDTLPPDLPTTYERVLERVNASDEENQIIVQRTLRWILVGFPPLIVSYSIPLFWVSKHVAEIFSSQFS